MNKVIFMTNPGVPGCNWIQKKFLEDHKEKEILYDIDRSVLTYPNGSTLTFGRSKETALEYKSADNSHIIYLD